MSHFPTINETIKVKGYSAYDGLIQIFGFGLNLDDTVQEISLSPRNAIKLGEILKVAGLVVLKGREFEETLCR